MCALCCPDRKELILGVAMTGFGDSANAAATEARDQVIRSMNEAENNFFSQDCPKECTKRQGMATIVPLGLIGPARPVPGQPGRWYATAQWAKQFVVDCVERKARMTVISKLARPIPQETLAALLTMRKTKAKNRKAKRKKRS